MNWKALMYLVVLAGAFLGGLAMGRETDGTFQMVEGFYGVWIAAMSLLAVSMLLTYRSVVVGPRGGISERKVQKLELKAAKLRKASLNPVSQIRLHWIGRRAKNLAKRINPESEADLMLVRRRVLSVRLFWQIFLLFAGFWAFAYFAAHTDGQQAYYDGDSQVSVMKAGLFSVDQLLRGVVFDLFETLDWSLSGLDHNSENSLFVTLIVAFRALVGSVILAAILIWFGMNDMWSRRALISSRKELKDRLSGISGA